MEQENRSPEEFYESLRENLYKDTKWPSQYVYKFIIRDQKDKTDEIHRIFDHMGAVYSTRQSSKGNFTSITVKVRMLNPEMVIEKYKEVAKIEGVIML